MEDVLGRRSHREVLEVKCQGIMDCYVNRELRSGGVESRYRLY